MRIRIEMAKCLLAVLIMLAGLMMAGCSSPTENEVVDMFTTPSPDDLGLKVNVEVDEEAGTAETCVEYAIPFQSDVQVEVWNVTGYKIMSWTYTGLDAGMHSQCWDSRNEDGKQVQSGIYLFYLSTGEFEDWTVFPICFSAEDCEDLYYDYVG